MSADARPVTTDALHTLGMVITSAEKRDAIHLAVEPVLAATNLLPGQHIGLLEDGSASWSARPLLGIVDPFVETMVKAGERFWLIVYPRQISSLRHVWEHPAFPASGETAQAGSSGMPDIVASSREWIERYADRLGVRYEWLMANADEAESSEWHYVCHPEDSGQFEGESVASDFWPHYAVVRGKQFATLKAGSFFTCSC